MPLFHRMASSYTAFDKGKGIVRSFSRFRSVLKQQKNVRLRLFCISRSTHGTDPPKQQQPA